MNRQTIIGIYTSLILALIATIKWEPDGFNWGLWLIMVLMLALTLHLFWLQLKKHFEFRIIHKKEDAIEKARHVFEVAKKYGGELYATHIYPIERLPEENLLNDFTNIQKDLKFIRLIYTDDPVVLDYNIRQTFQAASKSLSIEILAPHTNTVIPKFIWYILPRVNILSYSNEGGTKTMTSIGVFRIYTKNNIKDKSQKISPTIHFFFKRKSLHTKIRQYFEAFNQGHFAHFHSIYEYERSKNKLLLQSKFKSFLARLSFLTDDPTIGILHVSIFGQYNSFRKGVYDIGSLKVDFDIDLIVVCEKGKTDTVRERINAERNKLRFPTTLIWGPYNDYFYQPRSTDSVYIDVELFEEGDDYYVENSLLGYSIIPSCQAIYMQNESEHRLFKLLDLPDTVDTLSERANILIDPKQRKGLIDFKNLTQKFRGEYDPVRVASHIIRNLAWVITGHFNPAYDKALKSIEESSFNLIEQPTIDKAKTIIFNSNNGENLFDLTEDLIAETIDVLESNINKEKTSANKK